MNQKKENLELRPKLELNGLVHLIRYLLFIFMLCTANLFSQITEKRKTIDSLKSVISNAKNDTTKALTYSNLAFEFIYLNTDSLKYYSQKGLRLSENIGFQRGKAHNLNMYSRVAENENNFSKAITRQQEAIKILEGLKDSAMLGAAYYNVGAIYLRVRELDSARFALKRAEKIHRLSKDQRFLPNIYYALGNLNKAEMKFDMAIRNYALALDIARKEGNQNMVANAYGGMAQIYFSTDEKQKAIESYDKAIEIFRVLENYQNLAVLLSNLGGVYYDMKRYEDSELVLEEALVLKRKIGQNRSTVFTLGALGNLFTETKQFQKARKYYTDALSLISEDDHQAKFRILYNIGKSEYEDNRFDKSNFYFDQAYAIQGKTDILQSEVLELLQTKSKVEAKLGFYKKALELKERAELLQDSLLKIQNTTELNELKTLFEVSEKERQIAELDAANQKQQLEVAKSRDERTLLILAIIGFSLLAFSWHSRYRTKQQLSSKLQLALNEKEILLKEIHHRVKNNLQLVLSLLNIQARELKNEQVDAFLEKGEARIVSMALIHKTLYSNEDLSRVDIKAYSENLLHSIFHSFGLDDSKYTFTVNADNINFDIQTAVPLGLILNELSCNALKHAFVSREEGHLLIDIKHKSAEYFRLTVADDGIGIMDKEASKGSIGLELVSTLTEQLRGTMDVLVGNGTTFIIDFKEISKVA